MADKPKDFLERAVGDFAPGVDVATVPKNQDPKDLLFGKDAPPPTEAEPQGDEFFKWDATKELNGQRGAFYVDVPNGNRTERFWGKTRTEVTKNLAEAKKNANQVLIERPADRPRTPDMKLPYDPIQRKTPRTLSADEVYRITELAQTDPLKAQEMLFEARTGYTMDQWAQSIAVNEETRFKMYAVEITSDFWSSHQKDCLSNQANTTLIDSWLKDRKLPLTRNNLEIAFLDLKDKLAKPEPAVAPEEFTPPPPPVSPPSGSAPSPERREQNLLSGEEVATIQSGSLEDARSAIQGVFRRNRGRG